jgi:hypothetical protein
VAIDSLRIRQETSRFAIVLQHCKRDCLRFAIAPPTFKRDALRFSVESLGWVGDRFRYTAELLRMPREPLSIARHCWSWVGLLAILLVFGLIIKHSKNGGGSGDRDSKLQARCFEVGDRVSKSPMRDFEMRDRRFPLLRSPFSFTENHQRFIDVSNLDAPQSGQDCLQDCHFIIGQDYRHRNSLISMFILPSYGVLTVIAFTIRHNT